MKAIAVVVILFLSFTPVSSRAFMLGHKAKKAVKSYLKADDFKYKGVTINIFKTGVINKGTPKKMAFACGEFKLNQYTVYYTLEKATIRKGEFVNFIYYEGGKYHFIETLPKTRWDYEMLQGPYRDSGFSTDLRWQSFWDKHCVE